MPEGEGDSPESSDERPSAANTDRAILARYTDQPTALPRALRASIESACSAGRCSSTRWPTSTPRCASPRRGSRSARARSRWRRSTATGPRSARSRAQRCERVRLEPGLTCNVLTLLGEAGEPALARLRYTHRQRRAIENMRFVLESELEGRTLEPADADASTRRASRARSATRRRSSPGNDVAVLWRLLGYLRAVPRGRSCSDGSRRRSHHGAVARPAVPRRLPDRLRRCGRCRRARSRSRDVARDRVVVVVAIAVAHVLRQLGAWVRLRWMAILGECVARDLRTELYEHMQRLSLAFFSRKKTGSLITRVTADTDRLWEFLAFGVVDVSLSVMLARPRHRAALARLAARPRDGAADAVLLLLGLRARRAHEPALPPRVAEVVAA